MSHDLRAKQFIARKRGKNNHKENETIFSSATIATLDRPTLARAVDSVLIYFQ